MAFSQIATSVSVISSGLKGYQSISLTNFTTSAESIIAAGSAVEIANAFFLAGTTLTPNATSWTAITTANTAYITLTPSGSAGSQTIAAAYSETAPTWSTSKQGWYTTAASVTRYIGGVTKGSATKYDDAFLLQADQGNTRYQGDITLDDLTVLHVGAVSLGTTTEDTKSTLEKFLDWYKDNYIDSIIDSTQRMVDAIVGISSARADAEIADIERSTMSEETKAAKIRAIQRDQAERDKKLGIFSAIIDTAQAIIGFLAEPGGIPGIVLSVLAGITGAAQIAAISAQPLPALAAGGIVTGPTQALIGEAGPEIIFPLDQLGNFINSRGDFQDVGGGNSHVVVNLDGRPILDYVGRASRDGRILIDQRSVVA